MTQVSLSESPTIDPPNSHHATALPSQSAHTDSTTMQEILAVLKSMQRTQEEEAKATADYRRLLLSKAGAAAQFADINHWYNRIRDTEASERAHEIVHGPAHGVYCDCHSEREAERSAKQVPRRCGGVSDTESAACTSIRRGEHGRDDESAALSLGIHLDMGRRPRNAHPSGGGTSDGMTPEGSECSSAGNISSLGDRNVNADCSTDDCRTLQRRVKALEEAARSNASLRDTVSILSGEVSRLADLVAKQAALLRCRGGRRGEVSYTGEADD